MEFLMTYGWAILVVLAAIGALAYFGILSPGNFLPSSFTMSSGLSAGEFKMSDDGSLVLGFINSMGVGITVHDVFVNTSDSSAVLCNTATTVAGLPIDHANGVKKVYNFTCSDAVGKQGKKFKAAINVIYNKDAESINHTATGDLTTKVEFAS